jgi:dolichyl-phosphate-mannose--protein O-mannosyl transferase
VTGTAPPADAAEADVDADAEAQPAHDPTAQELAPRRDEASLPDRLRPAMPSSGLRGWIGPIIVTIIGGLLRFVDLGRPHAIIFDETYYPKSALGMLQDGYEQKMVENANDLILESDGNWRALDLFTGDPEFVVHPPLGKWTIALGEQLFGATPFGWRFAVAVLGTLAILMTARIARRLTRSDLVGTLAGLLLAVEGMHLVMSRSGLLDMVLAFWVLAAFGLLLIDRDRTRGRLADLVRQDGLAAVSTTWGPRLGLRPWRWAAAVTLGLACSVKWSGLWFLAFFILMSLVWDVSARRAIGVRRPWRATVLLDAPAAGLSMVAIAIVVYLTSWTGWFLTDGGYARQWAAGQPASFIPEALRSLWHYHAEAWRFHVGLNSPHPYGSNALSWFLQARPTSFYYENVDSGCSSEKCVAAVTALGNPLIWWIGILAVIHQLWRWIGRRDWRSGAVLVGIAAGWVPWLLYLDRTIFTFYVVVFVPFVVMAVAMTIGTILGPADAPARRRRDGAVAATVIVLAIVVVGWWFYPVWTGMTIPYEGWRMRMWFASWV